jgi:hypothetical protein
VTDDELFQALARAGIGRDESRWLESASLLAAFDALGRSGFVVLIKVDGERTNGQLYTVAILGRSPAEDSFRKDGAELQPLLRDALHFVVERLPRG